MPNDTHTTHEPDRVGTAGDEQFRTVGSDTGFEDDIHRQTTLLMFGGFSPPEHERAPTIN